MHQSFLSGWARGWGEWVSHGTATHGEGHNTPEGEGEEQEEEEEDQKLPYYCDTFSPER